MAIPTEFTVHQKSRLVDIAFDDGAAFSLPIELLRVYSPSAEVQGHAPGQEVLQLGKRDVGIDGVEPIGNYGIKPIFTDGHASGIFTWDYLYKLGKEQDQLWQEYLGRLQAAGFKGDTGREPIPELPGMKKGGGGCGSGSCGCH
jgi:DUF971 family protein